MRPSYGSYYGGSAYRGGYGGGYPLYASPGYPACGPAYGYRSYAPIIQPYGYYGGYNTPQVYRHGNYGYQPGCYDAYRGGHHHH